jgi:hypothetical protein
MRRGFFFGNLTLQVDDKQAIIDADALDLDVVGEREVARRDAPLCRKVRSSLPLFRPFILRTFRP